MRRAGSVLPLGGMLYLYGPFRRDGRHTAASNEAFDRDLRTKDPAWGVRDLEAVAALAATHGFAEPIVTEMPANNLHSSSSGRRDASPRESTRTSDPDGKSARRLGKQIVDCSARRWGRQRRTSDMFSWLTRERHKILTARPLSGVKRPWSGHSLRARGEVALRLLAMSRYLCCRTLSWPRAREIMRRRRSHLRKALRSRSPAPPARTIPRRT